MASDVTNGRKSFASGGDVNLQLANCLNTTWTTSLAQQRREKIRDLLSRRPRVPLGTFPTRSNPYPILTRRLNGPRLYIKRDDMTGLAFGGNKTRQLEYVFGSLMLRNRTFYRRCCRLPTPLIECCGRCGQKRPVLKHQAAKHIFQLRVLFAANANPVISSRLI